MTEGFGGTTVLTCRLQELNALTLNRRKRESNETVSDDQVAGNSTEQDTNSTTTTTPKSTTTTTPKPVSTHPCLDCYFILRFKILHDKKYLIVFDFRILLITYNGFLYV